MIATPELSTRSNVDTLKQRFDAIRDQSTALAASLPAEDQVIQSMPSASPTKWHLAHTTWFFETFVLRPHLPSYECFDTRFESLFNSYYRGIGEPFERARRGTIGRPTVATIGDYRQQVDRAMERFLGSPDIADEHLALIELGLQHEQQHQELILTDIKHALASNPLRPGYRTDLSPVDAPDQPPPMNWTSYDEGLYSIGHGGDGFCFDNELPRHQTFLPSFELTDRPVSCSEFIAFIDDGGYRDSRWWLSEGWQIVQEQGWEAPLYWERQNGQWWTMTLGGMRPVVDAEPVIHVSFFEADAYARWSGHRLPTEGQWEVASGQEVPDGDGFLEGQRFHPRALQDPSSMAYFGDCWEWTASQYRPYPGFRPWKSTIGEYNGKFMCNQFVLRGGSCATAESHIRPSYRNFFAPQARWQFSGFRLAR